MRLHVIIIITKYLKSRVEYTYIVFLTIFVISIGILTPVYNEMK